MSKSVRRSQVFRKPILEDIIPELKLPSKISVQGSYYETSQLSGDDIKKLFQIRWASETEEGEGSFFLSEFNKEFVYEIVCICSIYGINWFIDTFSQLIPKLKKDETHFIFSGPWFESQQNQYSSDTNKLMNKINIVAGVLECPKCHTKKTSFVAKQTRSADEPMTIIAQCYNCGHKWRD